MTALSSHPNGPGEGVEFRVRLPRSVHRRLRIMAAEQDTDLAGAVCYLAGYQPNGELLPGGGRAATQSPYERGPTPMQETFADQMFRSLHAAGYDPCETVITTVAEARAVTVCSEETPDDEFLLPLYRIEVRKGIWSTRVVHPNRDEAYALLKRLLG